MSWRFEELRDNKFLRERLFTRAKIISAIREFFKEREFFEAETPSLVTSPGMEPNLTPFETTLRDERGRSCKATLITSPEYALKKLLAAGFQRVFELARVWRNEEPWGGGHNPEFTMLEWYRAGADYTDIMRDAEELAVFVVNRIISNNKEPLVIRYKQFAINLAPPWERLSAREAFLSRLGVDLDQIRTAADFLPVLKKRGYVFKEDETFEELFHRLFLSEIEPTLGLKKPTILFDYPRELGALAKTSDKNPRYAERFEIYVAGMELANAFSELTDANEQRRRFETEADERRRLGKAVYPIDEEFLSALAAIPKAGGIALGVDRLVMLLTNASSIDDVLFFPASVLFKK